MPRVWQKLGSLLRNPVSASPSLATEPVTSIVVPVVALIINEEDRRAVSQISGTPISGRETWEVHFAESCEEAFVLAGRLSAPVILLDRDWPGMEWKPTVARLAALPRRACVVLISGVADTYLWQEVVRQDGYDVLPKPLRMEDVARVTRSAFSYWSIRMQPPAALAGRK